MDEEIRRKEKEKSRSDDLASSETKGRNARKRTRGTTRRGLEKNEGWKNEIRIRNDSRAIHTIHSRLSEMSDHEGKRNKGYIESPGI